MPNDSYFKRLYKQANPNIFIKITPLRRKFIEHNQSVQDIHIFLNLVKNESSRKSITPYKSRISLIIQLQTFMLLLPWPSFKNIDVNIKNILSQHNSPKSINTKFNTDFGGFYEVDRMQRILIHSLSRISFCKIHTITYKPTIKMLQSYLDTDPFAKAMCKMFELNYNKKTYQLKNYIQLLISLINGAAAQIPTQPVTSLAHSKNYIDDYKTKMLALASKCSFKLSTTSN